MSRRRFVQSAAITAGFVGLGRYTWAQGGRGQSVALQPYENQVYGYGTLLADPQRILDLPEGFTYTILSLTGDPMDDGFRVPGAPDGMAAFTGPDGRVIVVRNHEIQGRDNTFRGPFGLTNELFEKLDRSQVYDAARGRPALGGTTTFVYDPATRRVERQFLSLAGTLRNCAGGPTPWGTWISCEEDVTSAGTWYEKNHGYAFEVPATAEMTLAEPRPLEAMGRFYREAVAVDPRTSIVYQTEDRGDGLLYRFIPNVPGRLAEGGRSQVLALGARDGADMRNWPEAPAPRIATGTPMTVRWIDIDQPDVTRDDLRYRGFEMGAARFARGEGMWFGDGEFYFACTDGGLAHRGQIFRYRPSEAEGTAGEELAPATLELYLEPNDVSLLESCDNVTVAPWGDLLICEDQAAPQSSIRRQAVNYLRGVTPEGKMYTIARNRYAGNSELAGCCFAPDHPTLFLNIQVPGITLAVTGPWESRRG